MFTQSCILYKITDTQKNELRQFLTLFKLNPYTHYIDFHQMMLEQSSHAPDFFIEICEQAKNRDREETPFIFIQNNPIDHPLPVLSYQDPVNDKYKHKKSFISEAYLELFAILSGCPAIAYTNVNSGDVFQDILPMESLSQSQSQKTLVDIGFHKDLANHFVRPDEVNIICLRSTNKNKIFTTFVRNKDLLECLPDEITAILKTKNFYTPYDDLSTYGDKNNLLGDTDRHAVFYGTNNIAYFEGRTVGLTDEAKTAVGLIDQYLHKLKFNINMLPGDFVGIDNQNSLHGKEAVIIKDKEQQKIRWMMKTVNLGNQQKKLKKKFFVPEQDYLVRG